MMTTEEEGTVSAEVTNPLDRTADYTVRAHISQGYLTAMREINSTLTLEPDASQSVQWDVMPEDAAFGSLVLVSVRIGPRYPIPSRQGSCGVLVVDLPRFTGNQISTFLFIAGLLGMAGGAGLWIWANRPLKGRALDVTRAMGVLAVFVLLGLFFGLRGYWLPGAILFVILVLAVGTILGHFVNQMD
jgi:hypothetical protein